MATKINVIDKHTGETREVTLLNPAEKGEKYALELSNGEKMNGKPLTRSEAALRMGYLNARRDSAKAYNARQGKPNQKKGNIHQIIDNRYARNHSGESVSQQKSSKKRSSSKKKNVPVTTEFGD